MQAGSKESNELRLSILQVIRIPGEGEEVDREELAKVEFLPLPLELRRRIKEVLPLLKNLEVHEILSHMIMCLITLELVVWQVHWTGKPVWYSWLFVEGFIRYMEHQLYEIPHRRASCHSVQAARTLQAVDVLRHPGILLCRSYRRSAQVWTT